MSRVKPYKFHELVKALKKFDPRFEVKVKQGKGSHRMFYHPDINGQAKSFPLVCHGKGDEIDKRYIKGIINRFGLPDDVL
ncbi:MAG: type II toxin-antitoxin system HicA family toxin [candidate division Zixibacteria bacterium]|nr:type II toxin-antitoxin system HicA family toxin [candidate division Zixibacteria bacterium]